eukprot:GDKJ01026199.1.p1 GENE.GDKJ01026199.1~~GDKJ01026199.1.p1  ORF type:complete len:179 (+),score=40.22 GDKJ01026199.1:597-1133(+)
MSEDTCFERPWGLSPAVPFSLLDGSYAEEEGARQIHPIKTIVASWIKDLRDETGGIVYSYPFISKESSPLTLSALNHLFPSNEKKEKKFHILNEFNQSNVNFTRSSSVFPLKDSEKISHNVEATKKSFMRTKRPKYMGNEDADEISEKQYYQTFSEAFFNEKKENSSSLVAQHFLIEF